MQTILITGVPKVLCRVPLVRHPWTNACLIHLSLSSNAMVWKLGERGLAQVSSSLLNRGSKFRGPSPIAHGGSLLVKASDRGWLATSSSPLSLKTRRVRGAMHVKSVESSNVLPLVWCGS
ncbi:hypothetical protein TNCV_1636511 [Trichonephila clavipes]|uniref:Uncharacterized protein n=1 Tax=Trichonephila clavipes TaxID=2585209 RepID=A0A8X6RLI5_TRICX|nr:hypothetical protein TNCV_1636511 [Trichonephila clavipes]